MEFNKARLASMIDDYTSFGPESSKTANVSLDASVKAIAFLVPFIISIIIVIILFVTNPVIGGAAVVVAIPVLILWSIIISGIRIPNQWENLAIFRMGKFRTVKGPGLQYIFPMIEFGITLDMRVLTIEISKQSVITRDNVPIEIDGVLFFKVKDAQRAIVNIQDYNYAIAEYAKNSLRDVVGSLDLDEVLTEREKIQEDIRNHIEDKVEEWGLHADSIRLQDIQMPEDLKRMMSRQASAEREKRATIIKAEGDKLASLNLSEAARIMHESEGAMQLRTLQSIDSLGASQSNTVILFPVEIIELLSKFAGNIDKTKHENQQQQ